MFKVDDALVELEPAKATHEPHLGYALIVEGELDGQPVYFDVKGLRWEHDYQRVIIEVGDEVE